jgi:hypothetical protein
MNPPFLEEAWLVGAEVKFEDRLGLDAQLGMRVGIEHLGFEHRDGVGVATVRLSLGLHPEGAEDAVGDLAATFRLVYRMAPLQEVEDQRRFASATVLADAWPVWRGWLHGTLALVGLSPTPLPAQVPPEVVAAGPGAFDLAPVLRAG